MDLIYQSDAYEAFAGILVNNGKWHFITGEQRKKRPNFEGNRDNIREQGI